MKRTVFNDQVMVAIDIGTTKICVIVAQAIGNDMVEVIGIGKSPSHGLAKGVVVDIAKTVASIKDAVREAELMAGCTIDSAVIGISGGHIQSRSSSGMIPIKKREISAYDVQQVIASASAVEIAEGQQVLHVLPQYFVIDSKERILDPIGMYGVRLEAQVHIITGSLSSVHNLVKCCQLAGINVHDIVLEQLASGHAVLSDDERQLGVAMVDIGGGTSDLAIYHNGAIRHTYVLPVAGNHFTHDVAIGLQTTLAEAERVKKEAGMCNPSALSEDVLLDILNVDSQGTHIVLKSELAQIVHARAHELFTLMYKEITTHQMQPFIPAGLVLTGGGSLLEGIKDVAQSIFKIPVRIGRPQLDDTVSSMLDNPMYATGYGLILNALKKQDQAAINSLSGPLVTRLLGRMKSWVSDFF